MEKDETFARCRRCSAVEGVGRRDATQTVHKRNLVLVSEPVVTARLAMEKKKSVCDANKMIDG